jgi:hypothetical protein
MYVDTIKANGPFSAASPSVIASWNWTSLELDIVRYGDPSLVNSRTIEIDVHVDSHICGSILQHFVRRNEVLIDRESNKSVSELSAELKFQLTDLRYLS